MKGEPWDRDFRSAQQNDGLGVVAFVRPRGAEAHGSPLLSAQAGLERRDRLAYGLKGHLLSQVCAVFWPATSDSRRQAHFQLSWLREDKSWSAPWCR